MAAFTTEPSDWVEEEVIERDTGNAAAIGEEDGDVADGAGDTAPSRPGHDRSTALSGMMGETPVRGVAAVRWHEQVPSGSRAQAEDPHGVLHVVYAEAAACTFAPTGMALRGGLRKLPSV